MPRFCHPSTLPDPHKLIVINCPSLLNPPLSRVGVRVAILYTEREGLRALASKSVRVGDAPNVPQIHSMLRLQCMQIYLFRTEISEKFTVCIPSELLHALKMNSGP